MKRHKTKKVAVLLGLALAGGTTALVMPITTPAQAQYYNSSSASVVLNGQELKTSVPPLVENGRTLVPMRDIFEALGATVVWHPGDRSISAQKESTNIWLQIGNKTARVDNRDVWLDQAPLVTNGSTLVPLRFVSEALGAQVTWNSSQRIVNISMAGLDGTRGHRYPNHNNGNHDWNRGDHQPPRNNHARDIITVPENTVVPVTLDSRLSSATVRKGDEFWVTVKSDHVGDSEFPSDTKIKGVVTDVTRKTRDHSGAISVNFRSLQLPNGKTQAIDGSLISLDKNDVRQTSSGRIVANPQKQDGADSTTVLIGAGAGYVLGHVILGQNSVLSGVIGALGGYIYGNHQGERNNPEEAVVPSGTELGVRLNQAVRYEDDNGYESHRAPYLR